MGLEAYNAMMILFIFTAVATMAYDFVTCASNPNVYINEVNQRLYDKQKLLLAGIPSAIYVAYFIFMTPKSSSKTLVIIQIFTYNPPYHVLVLYIIAAASYVLIAGTSYKHALSSGLTLVVTFFAGFFLMGLILSMASTLLLT